MPAQLTDLLTTIAAGVGRLVELAERRAPVGGSHPPRNSRTPRQPSGDNPCLKCKLEPRCKEPCRDRFLYDGRL